MTNRSADTYTNTNPYAANANAVDAVNSLAGIMGGLPATVVHVFTAWQKRAQDRNHLRELDNRMIADMGLSHADVANEVSKPFWRS